MAVAGPVDDVRDGRLRFDGGDQAGATPGHEQINPLGRLHEILGALPRCVLKDLYGVGGDAPIGQRLLESFSDGCVRPEGI